MSGDALTFAEAMTADPAEVECRFDEHWWLLKDPRLSATLTLRDLRVSRFRRRVRPVRSRAQEMAEEMCSSDVFSAKVLVTAAIRAVCEYLRAESRRGFERNPDAIEREFLEPR